MNKDIKAPVAEKQPTKLEKHGDIRTDDYFWMRLTDAQKNAEVKDEQTQKVYDYLNAENAYYEEMTKETKEFQEELFQEMKGRIKEDDESVPYKKDGYFYITRYEKGQQYPIYSRKKETLEAEEEIMFNVNNEAKGYDYFQLGGLNVSPDNKMTAFATDTVSRRQYFIRIKNLETGKIYKDIIENTTGGSVWANDNKTLFYAKKDPVTLRSSKIYKHTLGSDASLDELVYEEKDDTFGAFVTKSKSKDYIIIGSYSTVSTEYHVLDANNPDGELQIIQPRERDLEYEVAHYGDHFYIKTNKDGATNFKLMKTPVDKPGKENWVDVIPHREDTLFEDFSIFKDYLVLEERNEGLNKIRIKRWDGTEDYYLPFEEETYSAGVYGNPEFDTEVIRYSYNSMTTPSSVIDFNMKDRSKEVKKEQEVLGGKFDKNNYVSKRIWVPARDGKKVALSIVHHKDTKLDKNTPILQYAYGSYGYTINDGFSTTRLSLLDRGFVYALAHIRGSQYLGREWYEDGKMLNKKNTFTDFIDCSKYLIDNGYTSPEHLYAMGGSAGGLLMGAIVNMNPELYNGIIAAVPFVDVISTMLDDSIPLTTGEYDEWGNPNNKEYYDYIKSYSPYDQVEAKAYPNMLVTTGLHDSQVQYWEPAKWVAKLRELKTDNNMLFLHTNMEAGHGGASGRFDALKETAEEYTFFLMLEGKLKK
ncbi:S9 family peptidase [Tenacibaculum mesophilum]|uniref:Proline-specific endopeptidase n=2 Tax=Tenacibaculum TaxID=104267 RepID=A0AAE9SG98_9FLAO|nr:S9 family peptidase [Tenacibaculum mesophilum]AZJ33905.1 S9 family peptidase [Tenacibaculum mesophilum]KAF9658008.1 S9 family peptidase [Tenacibaculum mesophilum]QFS27158.1 prolyl oligopeptidase family serine peptidase [Tenacibaculum mesophilum]UTD14579.1 S9 family peptidase [Tenacibaculum mesophilum]BFF41339.1 oligopeptidase B [Tenacibaculum mesophilum]